MKDLGNSRRRYNSGEEDVNITGKEDAKFGTGNSTAGIGVATEADAKIYAITTSSTAVPSTWYSSHENVYVSPAFSFVCNPP